MSRGNWHGRPSWPNERPFGDDAVRWLRLDTPLGSLVPTNAVTVTMGDTDADGWTELTITGVGTIRDGVAEQRCYLYDVVDIRGEIADLSAGLHRLAWVVEVDDVTLGADVLVHAGPAVFQGSAATPTAVDRAFFAGFCPDSSGGSMKSSATFDAGATNTTSSATDAVRMDAAWLPYRDPSSPGFGVGTATWAEADGSMVGTSVATAIGSAVVRSRVWRLALALGVDSTSTTPNTLRVRVGAVALAPM
jgi:hypothetical protein